MIAQFSTRNNKLVCFKQNGAICTLSGKPLKLIDQFTYLGSNISSAESDVNIRIVKAWIAIDRLSINEKPNLSDKIKWDFFQSVARLALLYSCTTWTLTKRMGERLNRNYTRMLRAVLDKSRKQHPTNQQLYCRLPPISQTIQDEPLVEK